MALQAMAHRLLGHTPPTDYADFLEQRLEINYYAACCLMPETAAVAFLSGEEGSQPRRRGLPRRVRRDARGRGDAHDEPPDEHLGIRLHFLRVDGAGAINRVYENDDLPLPMDVTGSVEARSCAGASPPAPHSASRTAPSSTTSTPTPRRHVLVLEPDRQDRRRRVLDHRGRALRRRSLVPRS
jgi:hypothetical protein